MPVHLIVLQFKVTVVISSLFVTSVASARIFDANIPDKNNKHAYGCRVIYMYCAVSFKYADDELISIVNTVVQKYGMQLYFHIEESSIEWHLL